MVLYFLSISGLYLVDLLDCFLVTLKIFYGKFSLFCFKCIFGYLVGLVLKCDSFKGQTRQEATRASLDYVVKRPRSSFTCIFCCVFIVTSHSWM